MLLIISLAILIYYNMNYVPCKTKQQIIQELDIPKLKPECSGSSELYMEVESKPEWRQAQPEKFPASLVPERSRGRLAKEAQWRVTSCNGLL